MILYLQQRAPQIPSINSKTNLIECHFITGRFHDDEKTRSFSVDHKLRNSWKDWQSSTQKLKALKGGQVGHCSYLVDQHDPQQGCFNAASGWLCEWSRMWYHMGPLFPDHTFLLQKQYAIIHIIPHHLET